MSEPTKVQRENIYVFLRIIVMALLYYGTGILSLMMLQKDNIITVSAFAPEGFALAAVLIYGRSILPGIFLGQFALALSLDFPITAILGISLVNTAEAAIAYWLFYRFKLNRHLSEVRDLLGLIVLIVFILQPFSALLSNILLYLFNVHESYSIFWQNSFFWWFGNVMGQLLFTPMLLILYEYRKNLRFIKVFLTIIAFASYNYLLQGIAEIENISLLLIATLPLTIYLATRSLLYASIATVTLSLVSAIMVYLGIGTFARSLSEVDNIIDLNFYIVCQIVIVLLVGILFKEKEDAINYLKSMAHYDFLTGLPNRHLLWEKIHHTVYLSHERKCENAICFVDLDGFKAINDNYGHYIGDQLLKEVAYKLRTFTYGDDELLRLGGDEFLIIFNQVGNIDAFKDKLNAILDAVSSIDTIDGHVIDISLSLGISWCPRHGTDVNSLIEAADNAMYEAKKRGKNQYVFADELIGDTNKKDTHSNHKCNSTSIKQLIP